jgi:hypothetical protein
MLPFQINCGEIEVLISLLRAAYERVYEIPILPVQMICAEMALAYCFKITVLPMYIMFFSV